METRPNNVEERTLGLGCRKQLLTDFVRTTLAPNGQKKNQSSKIARRTCLLSWAILGHQEQAGDNQSSLDRSLETEVIAAHASSCCDPSVARLVIVCDHLKVFSSRRILALGNLQELAVSTLHRYRWARPSGKSAG